MTFSKDEIDELRETDTHRGIGSSGRLERPWDFYDENSGGSDRYLDYPEHPDDLPSWMNRDNLG